jgi:hypothetical protein
MPYLLILSAGMIDYKEFCDKFRLAANEKLGNSEYSYWYGKRSRFARSKFLTDKLGKHPSPTPIESSSSGGGGAAQSPAGRIGAAASFLTAYSGSSTVSTRGGGGGAVDGTVVKDASSIDGVSATSTTTATTAAIDTTTTIDRTSAAVMESSQQGSSSSSSARATDLSAVTSLMDAQLAEVTAMGDIQVHSAKLIPEVLEQGVWPEDYTLSDHGMLEVVFRVPEAPVTIF